MTFVLQLSTAADFWAEVENHWKSMEIAAQTCIVNLPSDVEYEGLCVRENLTPICSKLDLALFDSLAYKSELEYYSKFAEQT